MIDLASKKSVLESQLRQLQANLATLDQQREMLRAQLNATVGQLHLCDEILVSVSPNGAARIAAAEDFQCQ